MSPKPIPMHNMLPGRTAQLNAIFGAMLVATSCARPVAPAPQPEAAPVGATPSTPPGAPAASSSPRDSTRQRALDRVGIPDPGSRLACTVAGRVRLDADSVALRFTAAFLKTGILPIRLSLPSVAGVSAGPADITSPAPSRISARAHTESRGDSTAYRVQFHVAPPQQGWAAGDSAVATGYTAGLCGQVEGLAFPVDG